MVEVREIYLKDPATERELEQLKLQAKTHDITLTELLLFRTLEKLENVENILGGICNNMP